MSPSLMCSVTIVIRVIFVYGEVSSVARLDDFLLSIALRKPKLYYRGFQTVRWCRTLDGEEQRERHEPKNTM